MHNTHIPFFKEVIIMSNACEVCGYRNSEVKPGGGFSDRGTQITLQARDRLIQPLSMTQTASQHCSDRPCAAQHIRSGLACCKMIGRLDSHRSVQVSHSQPCSTMVCHGRHDVATAPQLCTTGCS